ncbi:gamma-glutamyltransferase [Granulicella aggregans]|uniref:gamma-glutamyltransferase n=1 Tax=Granulicella aggregans TaxID=474949 RepID=UPI0021E08CE9|nr:gamma-glutamyltransferase [Granulicella aggregans]
MPAIYRRRVFRALAACSLIALPALQSAALLAQTDPPPVRAQHAMVVSIQHDAADAGVAMVKAGGNAVDAAVAVGFALAVTFPQAGNLGGGGFMLIRDKSGQAHFLDYRERAPAAATADMYLDAQKNVVPGLSTQGIKASGVPGSVAGLVYAEKTYGKLTLKQVMAPAIRLASEGYVLTAEEANNFVVNKAAGRLPEAKRIFQRDGNLYKEGDRFVQPELAKTLTRIAADPDDFYKGEIAGKIADYFQQNGGLITRQDLASYKVEDRKPLTGSYRGYDIVTAPPPSSGGIVLLETLNILSGYDLSKMGDRSPQQVHLLIEAFRRTYMDRNDYLGDPAYVTMPLKQMADPAYAAAWRKTIDPLKPTPSKELVRPAGFLPPVPTVATGHESTETTHFSVVDKDGNAVSSTYTLNGLFGSGVVVPGLGFVMNNEMDDFASKPGTANMMGLVQGVANGIAPGKRPLSSMTPTMLLKNGKIALVLGSPGGSTIITTVISDIVSVVDNGLNLQQAADAPRFHNQFLPDRIDVEKNFPLPLVEELKKMGYTVNRAGQFDEKNPGVWGDSEMIAVDPKTGELRGADDQRHHFGKAAGY